MTRSNHTIFSVIPSIEEHNPLFVLIKEFKREFDIDLTNNDLAMILNCSPSLINSYFSKKRRICEDRSAYISLMIEIGIKYLFEIVYSDGKVRTPTKRPTPPIKRTASQIKKVENPVEYVQLTLF